MFYPGEHSEIGNSVAPSGTQLCHSFHVGRITVILETDIDYFLSRLSKEFFQCSSTPKYW